MADSNARLAQVKHDIQKMCRETLPAHKVPASLGATCRRDRKADAAPRRELI